MSQGHSGKVRAFLLAFLMATISMSASLPSWEFSTLEEKSAFQTYSTNSTVDLTLGHGITIPTNLVGNASTGTYEFESELEKMHFATDSVGVEGKFGIGYRYFCLLVNTGELKCSGVNYYGQLGIGSTDTQNTLQTVDLGTGRTAISVSVGQYHTCAILDDGSLKCWGSNSQGQLGIGSQANSLTPQAVNLGTGRTAISVSVGQYHTCAILDDGSLKCWGHNSQGQLGIGSQANSLTPQSINLGSGRTAKSVDLGGSHTCAILDNGVLKCWGNGPALGTGSTAMQITPQTINLGSGRTAVSLGLGQTHSCAILDDSSLKCWGYNTYGQLGTGSTTNQFTPQQIFLGNFRSAKYVDAGNSHTCVILDDNSTKCWGQSYYGAVGTGTSTYSNVLSPQIVGLGIGRTARTIALSAYNSCAVLDDFSVKCWGQNSMDFLGIGTTSNLFSPELLFNSVVQDTQEISTGDRHTCTIDDENVLQCWGSNNYGELGIGSTAAKVYTPQSVVFGNGRTVDDVSLGQHFTCAILDDSSLKCWGYNIYGQLGIGTSSGTNSAPQSVNLGSGRTASSVALGQSHTCAILDDGSLKCWGYGNYGQLGLGNSNTHYTPQSVNLGTGRSAVSISANQYQTCAILDDSTLKCWGSNYYGQIGTGSSSNFEYFPQLINLGSGRTAASVSAGYYHTCAILDDGSLKCWGRNSDGQLGLGSTTDYSTPQTVNLGTGRTAVSVTTGYYHTCVILDDNSTKCWGQGSQAQLGQGTTITKSTLPLSVNFGYGRTAKSVSGGGFHTCAVLDDNSLNCWGRNNEGQVGNGMTTSSFQSPTLVPLRVKFPIHVFQTPSNNSWYGYSNELGVFNLDVWYNTTTSSTFHRIRANVESPISYSSNVHSLTVNQSASISPSNFSCNSCRISISPELPTGMVFNDSTASITGTPQTVTSNNTYVIFAINSSGSFKLDISLEVVDVQPNVSSSTISLHYTKGFRNLTNDFVNSGGNLTRTQLIPPVLGLSSNNFGHENLILSLHGGCAILSIGLECWGEKFSNLSSRFAYDESDIIDVSLSSTNVCALNITGDVLCMGENTQGQINSSFGSVNYSEFVDGNFESESSIIQIAVVSDKVCVLSSLNEIICQGVRNYSISDIGDILELDSGEKHYCLTTSELNLYCWGNNQYSAIGNSQSTSASYWSVSPNLINIGSGKTVLDFDAGEKHTCVVRNDGKAMCWGTGDSGQIGDGYAVTHMTPQMVDSPSWASYQKISSGNSHTCAMLDDGGIMCWGNNSDGQLGDGTNTNSLFPVNVTVIPSSMDVVDVIAGDGGTCVVDDRAGVWCWGNNTNGKLSLNSTIDNSTSPQPMHFSNATALMGVLSIGSLTGAPLSLQSLATHRLYGYNTGGSDDVNITISVGLAADYPTTQFNLTRNTSTVNVSPNITGGPYTFTAVPELPAGLNLGLSNGTIWGMPTEVHPLTNHTLFVENNSGYDQVSFVVQVHDIPPTIQYPFSSYTLIRNWTIDPITPSHQDGHVEKINISSPLPTGLEMDGFTNPTPIQTELGAYHTCVIVSEILKCWGRNYYGELGIGGITGWTVQYTTPQAVDLGTGRTAVSVSAGQYHTCAVLDNGSLKCWGRNYYGELGNGGTTGYGVEYTTPQAVNLGTGRTAVSVSAGQYHTCAVLDDGSLKCWGQNSYGQLGISSTTNQNTPQAVDLGTGRTAVSVTTSQAHTCAVLDDGSLKCWGRDYYGELGIGGTTGFSVRYTTPQAVDLGTGRTAVSVSAGQYHTCAVLDNGSLKCWGRNYYGELGNGGTTGYGVEYTTPQAVNLGTGRTAVSVSAGQYHTCAVLDDGSLKCWGQNSYGQLGISSTTNQNTPQAVDLGTGRTAVSVSAGLYHTCAVLDDGSLKCWGFNTYGQLGTGDTTDRTVPTHVNLFQTQSSLLGNISGGPLSTTPGKNYTITANNTYGSSNVTLYIEVVPAYDYGNNTLVLTRNQTMSTRSPIITGGSYNVSISPTLPQGLFFETSNGSIWGTPTINQTAQTYTIAVSNLTGSDSIELSIAIGEIAPITTFDTSNVTLVRGFNITRIHDSQTGGNVLSVEANPSLPQGLVFSSLTNNVSIEGTPTAVAPWTDYTIWSNNSFGSDSNIISMRVVPAYDYGNNTLVLTRNQTMSTRSPIITGGSYNVSITPTLPQGLFFEPSNGSIWGTPTINQTAQTYTVAVSNLSGSDTINISIAIGEIAPITAYDTSNVTLVRGFNITRIHDSQTGGNILSVEANPSLPQGLVFSSLTNNVSIEGTPTTLSPWTDYTIWSNNSFGSDSNIISMRVVPAYDYGNNTLVLTRNQTMSTRSPIITGGPFSSITIQPALPTGLFFEPSNGSIWGTPIMNQVSTSYMVTVSNQYGTDTTVIFIAISEIPPILEYNMSDMSYRRGFLSTHPLPILTGGAVATFEVHPPLPQGLLLNPATGILSGIPSVDAVSTVHTIWANNSFGSSSWSIDVEVLPGIDHPSTSIQLTRNVTMSPYAPTINIVERVLSIEPDLPVGLTFDTQTAVISGTSLIPLPSTTFSIKITNSTGTDWLNFTLTVDEIVPHVVYSRTNSSFYTGFGFEPLSPEGDAGYPEIWAWNGSSVSGVELSKFNSTQTFSSSGSNICTITSDYRAVCWGTNDMGQLGQGNTNTINTMVNVTLSSLEEPVDIAVGKHHTCVVTSGGAIECWGQNDFGQLGRGFKCPYGSYANGCNGNFAVTLPGLATYSGEFGFIQVSVGDTHTCGLLVNGTSMCWGSNVDGQLGIGNTVDSFVPAYTAMPQSASFTQIDLGKAHSCATNYSGELFCWGRNSFGQLGDGTINNRLSPTLVNLPTGFSVMSVSAGGDHSCVVFNGSQPACWGRNAQGQLGDGTLLGKLEPRLISNTAWSGVSSITAGEEQTCAVTLAGEVWCWGQSRVGMFSQTTSIVTLPVQVETQNSIGASSVAVGEQHICISTTRWSMMCTGDNQAGQIPWMSSSVVSEFAEYTGMLVHVNNAFAGTIYGTPGSSSGSITLEMSITNSAGTHYVQHTIQVQESYSYSASFIETIRGQVLTPVIPTLSGIGNGQFTISPSLPNGLLLDGTTGVLSGTPSVNSTQKTYQITFANRYGAVSYSLLLVAYEPAADIVYSTTEIEITRAGGFIEYSPSVSNGVVSEWSIVPTLPDGLSFANGVISGQALNNQSTTMYRIYGNNSGGVTFVDLNITILEPAPEFIPLQSAYVVERGQLLSNIVVGNIGGNISAWTITPQLPDGLVFADGMISGTPTVNMSSIVFTIRAENTGGFDEINFTLQVLEPAPLIDSTSAAIVGIRNNSIEPLILVNSGGMTSEWSIIPQLPSGLTFENGTIYGTPMVNSTSELFTVTASNEGGSSQFTFYIEVFEPEPQFTLSTSNFLLFRGVAFNAIEVSSSGGNIASFSIRPPLPSGMFFDENRGMIQGVPLIVSPEIQYTITAENSGGTYQQLLTIQVLNQGPVFTLPFETISLTERVEMAKFAPFLSSDVVVDTWSLEFAQGEQLPEGLVFDSTTGSIFGRPAEVSPLMNITLNATNDGGFYSLSFTLKILSDYDGDTIPDELDEDDDNDGYSDKEEELKNSDPFDSGSNPIEGFEVIIPNTEISLGAWDIIGMMTGIPLIVFLSFSLLTRNKRTARFLEQLESAKSRKDIAAVAEAYESAIKWRLIGPHQGMRLERIRAEADDKLEETERQFKYKVEDKYKQLEPKKEEPKAQFFDKVDQTPLVEQSKASAESEESDDEQIAESEESEKPTGEDSEESKESEIKAPSIDAEPSLIDENGRQWYHDDEKRYWWRDESQHEWSLLDSKDSE